MRRLIVTAVTAAALVVPGTLAVAGMSAPAGAAAKYSITCSSLSGGLTKVTMSKCSGAASSQTASLVPKTGTVTITWSPDKKTTKTSIPLSGVLIGPKAPFKCTTGVAVEIKGSVIAGGTATFTKKGDALLIPMCDVSNKLSLKPGMKAEL